MFYAPLLRKVIFGMTGLVSPLFSTISQQDYEDLMGAKTPLWSFVTEEDKKYLKVLEEDFTSKNDQIEARQVSEPNAIPKILHFIWLGPKAFPETSIKNVTSWVDHHPGYEVMFWTDYERPLPSAKMHIKYVRDFPFKTLQEAFNSSDNFGEKSDVLRYEILYQMGGVYIDHDVECFESIDPLISPFEIVCGIEPPHKPIGETSINVCNNLIASSKGHPVIDSCIHLTHDKWEEIGRYFQGKDPLSITRRVFYRTFSSFDQAVKKAIAEHDPSVLVLPSLYFNTLGKEKGLYAHHSYASTWFENETPFEKTTRIKLDKITKKQNQILQILAGIALVNILLITLQVYTLKRKEVSC